MIPGNLNCKITESQPKTTGKHKISQHGQKYKNLLKKTAFPSRSNSDNSKSSNPIDKKIFKSFAENELQIKTDVKQEPSGSGKENDATNTGTGPGPVRLRSDGRHKIKAGTTHIPVIAGSATMARSSSVTHNKDTLTKNTIKHVPLQKLSNDAKKGDALPKTECTPTENSSIIAVDCKNPTVLKKSTTCPPCMKLEQDVNSCRPKRTLDRNLPKPTAGNVSRPGDKTRSLSRELTVRKTVKISAGEKPPERPERPKLGEVKRMKSEGDSIGSRNTRISSRTAPLLPRKATSEIKDFNKNNKCPKIGTDKETSTIKPTEKKGEKLSRTGLKNQVLHVHTADSVLESERPDTDANESTKRNNSDPHLNLPGRSSLCPLENHDNFDSIDGKIHEDEILSQGKRISNDLEWEIRETSYKTDLLQGSEDDFGDSVSDIIRQLHSLNGQQGPNTDPSVAANKTHAECENRSHSLDPNAGKKLPQTEADRESNDSQPRKNIHLPPTENPGPETKSIITYSKQGKSSKAEQSLRIEGKSIRFGQNEERNSEAGASCIPSQFFQTHKNLGFIGKEEDEERVSFDPALVTLYQPRETQMLLYDLANCIATQAYLRMCGINYVLAERKNAEHMSPSGKVPFVSSCLCIIPEFEGIVSFMQYKKYSCARIRECDKAAFRATISMIVDTLEIAERYICWYDKETVITYTKPRIGGLFPFPLNHVIYWKKRYEERKHLALEETKETSSDKVLRKISDCFNTLSQLLGNNSFFFGDACTEIDALVYGHIYAAFTTQQEGLIRDLQLIIKQFPNLIIFAINFDKMFLLHKFSSPNLPPLGSDSSVMNTV